MVFRRRRFRRRVAPRRMMARKARRIMRRRRRTPMNVMRTIGGFPPRLFAKFQFYSHGIGAGTGATPADIDSFVGNGIAGTPVGWTSAIRPYDNFIVHASSIKVTFSNLSLLMPIRAMVFPYNDNNANTYSTITPLQMSQISTQDMSVDKIVGVMDGGHDRVSIFKKVKLATFFGLPKLISAYEDYIGNTGSPISVNTYSDPVTLMRWAVAVDTMDGSNLALNSVRYDVEITYFLEFFERLTNY